MNRYLRTRNRTIAWRSTKNTKVGAEPKLCSGTFGVISEKGNRLKREKAIQTSMDYYRVISKCKGHECNFTWAVSRAYKLMNSVPVLFTRTCHPAFASRLYLYLLSSWRYICNLMSFLFFHNDKIEMTSNYKCSFGLKEGKSPMIISVYTW